MKLKDIKFTVNKTISKDKKKKIKEELQAKKYFLKCYCF